MNASILNSILISLVFAFGCSSSDAADGTGSSGTGNDASGSTGTADDAGGNGQSGAGNGASGSTGDPADGATAEVSCDPTASNGGDTPLLECNQIPGDCGTCLAENACDQFMFRCALDTDCVCLAECVGEAGLVGTDDCLNACNLTGSPSGFFELAADVAVMCPDSDECSVPTGYEPPPRIEPEPAPSNASIGGGDLADCSFDAGLAYDPTGEILQLQSADGDVCVRIDRRNDGNGSNANTSWTLLDILVGPLGEVCHTAQPGDLCWYSSHHNFADWAHVWCGSRRYDLIVAVADHGAAPTYLLHVFEGQPLGDVCAPTADGVCPIGTPIELLPVP